MKENKQETRTETQQQLMDKAQLIEEAKRIAEAIRHNPEEMRRSKLKEMFPELSAKQIEDLLK